MLHSTLTVPADSVLWGVENFQVNQPPEKKKAVDLQMRSSDKSKRILIILRVSGDTSTTKNQLFSMNRHISKLGSKPTILDLVATNWKKPISAMESVIVQVANGEWDEIHLWRTDRAGRDHYFDVRLWNTCKESKVLLWFVDDDYRSDREGDEEKFYRASVDAQVERKRISKRTREAVARIRAEAALEGRSDPWSGRKKGTINKVVAKKIELVFDLLRLDYGSYKIREHTKLATRTICKIRDMDIEEARRLTGKPNLKDWRK